MGTIHDLPGWGNADFREIHARQEGIEWMNSEQRSATEFTTRSVAEGECIASDEKKCRGCWGEIERNPENLFVIGVIGRDQSRVACFARDLRRFLSFASSPFANQGFSYIYWKNSLPRVSLTNSHNSYRVRCAAIAGGVLRIVD